MKKAKWLAALTALILLLTAALPCLAMTDAEYVWGLLNEYSGSEGKNGCFLIHDSGSTSFGASQANAADEQGARMRAVLQISEKDGKIVIAFFARIENGETNEDLADYRITRLTVKADDAEFFWDAPETTGIGGPEEAVMVFPETAFYEKLKEAENISVAAEVYHEGNVTFIIDDEDRCGNFREFARLVCENGLFGFCDLDLMRAGEELCPMRTD